MKMGNTSSQATIAKRIKQARVMSGLSQSQVANLLALHRPSISEIEAGNRKVSADELVKFSNLFDVSLSWLVGEAPETLDLKDPNLELAARELQKLKPEDLERLLKLLAAMKISNPGPGITDDS